MKLPVTGRFPSQRASYAESVYVMTSSCDILTWKEWASHNNQRNEPTVIRFSEAEHENQTKWNKHQIEWNPWNHIHEVSRGAVAEMINAYNKSTINLSSHFNQYRIQWTSKYCYISIMPIFMSSHCNFIEDRIPVDIACGCPISKVHRHQRHVLMIIWPQRGSSYHYTDVTMSPMASQITSLWIVYSNVYSSSDQRRHHSSASLAFVRRIHRGPVNSPHKRPATRKMFSFDDVIMDRDHPWYHHTRCAESETVMLSRGMFVCVCVCWSRCLSGPFDNEGLMPHDQYFAGI